ncbi:SpoIIE family protein phosphatase [Streptomyces sp. NPDC006544]|uniref:ATP-binding SpoIIE family protein phosphatase n=1 Tax=Streptomyces sp. NPDC006544 TaxID=3154583 RepID=UPI0033B767F8
MREPEHGGPRPASASVSDVAAVVLDDEGVVIACSGAAAAMLDCSPGRLCPPLLALLPGEGPPDGAAAGLAFEVIRLRARARGAPASDARWLVLVTPTATATEAAARDSARRRAALSHGAAASIGASLDVTETAEAIVELLVPGFADLATVDLAEPVLVGEEPARLDAGGDVRLWRTASAQSAEIAAEGLLVVGEAVPPVADSAVMRPLMEGRAVLVADVAVLREALGADAESLRQLVPGGAHSSVAVPLHARGLVLGCVTVWRGPRPSAFGEEDAVLLQDVVSRAALGVDNARRYTREHRSVVALQRSLLPRSSWDFPAAQTAAAYQPAGGGLGVGGDWFDVISLPSLRVAFVVGDVVGHGLDATAAMARLRTAVQTLADLDLDPGELLTHLDDLVLGLSSERTTGESPSELAVLGATCLYAVYDPVTGECSAATAGHPPPALLAPDEDPVFVGMAPGPPLGVGGMPFEVTEFGVRPGSMLAFFTNGLVGSRDGDIDQGMEKLRSSLAAADRDLALAEICRGTFDSVLPREPVDDVALLLARTHGLSRGHIAQWELEADLSLVAHARELVTEQLSDWQLDDLAFVTELVASELVTNAIRYAGGPVGLRLIRDRKLICEVSDPSSTQPRLRRARETDEGGRGLFLVAQLTDRWGCRFTRSGKTIWTEQGLGEADPAPRHDAAPGRRSPAWKR